jgi:hypothetical protein
MNEREADLLLLVSQYHDKYIEGEKKFKDEHIQADPELIDLALEYLTVYTGTFEFITDIRERSRGSLSVSQARGVLNTMLAEHRRKEHPLESISFSGIVGNGYYLLPGEAELEVKSWRDDGTRLLRILEQGRWTAFASINPDYSYRIWGKENTDARRAIAQTFFGADVLLRQKWAEGWSDLTGKCYIDGNNPSSANGLCEVCASGQWATQVIHQEEQQSTST